MLGHYPKGRTIMTTILSDRDKQMLDDAVHTLNNQAQGLMLCQDLITASNDRDNAQALLAHVIRVLEEGLQQGLEVKGLIKGVTMQAQDVHADKPGV
jgi:hypothetical protein